MGHKKSAMVRIDRGYLKGLKLHAVQEEKSIGAVLIELAVKHLGIKKGDKSGQ